MLKSFFTSSKPLYIFLVFATYYFTLPFRMHENSSDLFIWGLISACFLLIFFVIGTVGLFRLSWRYFKRSPQIPRDKHRMITSVIAFLIFIPISFIIDNQHYQDFDPVAWQNSSRSAISERQRMIDDLTDNVLPDKTESDLLYLLGDPDYLEDAMPNSDADLQYLLGIDQGLSFGGTQYQWLLIWIDENGQFEKYRFTTLD